MRKLWSASNIKVYGGGVAETEFLGELSQLIGDFTLRTSSVSVSKWQRSTSLASRREHTFEVSELTSLPRGRAVVFGSGASATLVATVPWMEGKQAEAVRASITAHDPSGTLSLPASVTSAHPWLKDSTDVKDWYIG